VPGQCLEQVNGNALVSQVRQKRPAPAVAAGPFQARAFVDQCKGLSQAVGVESQFDAFLARKLPQTVNNMKIETSISLEMRDEEVEIYGKPNCWDIGRG
jgi:hypothetical protein